MSLQYSIIFNETNNNGASLKGLPCSIVWVRLNGAFSTDSIHSEMMAALIHNLNFEQTHIRPNPTMDVIFDSSSFLVDV